MVQDPRGFLLPRFVNVGRHLMAGNVVLRPTSKNLQESGLLLQVLVVCLGGEKAAIHRPKHSALDTQEAAYAPLTSALDSLTNVIFVRLV